MALEIEFGIQDELKSVLRRLPKNLKSNRKAYSGKVLSDIVEEVLPVIYKGTKRDIKREVSYVMNKRKDEIKSDLIERIERASGKSWDEIKGQELAGRTRAQNLERSFENTKKGVVASSMRIKSRFNRAEKYIETGKVGIASRMGLASLGVDPKKAYQEMAKNIAEELTKSIGKTMGARESTLVSTEAHSVKHLEFLENNKTATVAWRTAADEKVCSICGPLDGVIFSTAENAPMIPRHPNCRCELEVLTPDFV